MDNATMKRGHFSVHFMVVFAKISEPDMFYITVVHS